MKIFHCVLQIVIANDITYLIGSFGVREDVLFREASELARRLGIPRLYVAANSGARIGLAEEVKSCFRIAWYSRDAPEKGFKYLYVTPDDYKRLEATRSVFAELIEDDGERRYRILDVIGKGESLGVENLAGKYRHLHAFGKCVRAGSGMIAGETSDAYNDIITMSLVSCRTVGIGAYLVRLGQRTVQVESSHIILTGAPALNKLLGREVYTSSNQLGGPQIMHNNGARIFYKFPSIYEFVYRRVTRDGTNRFRRRLFVVEMAIVYAEG
jgi:acetyl-CoA carboxylase/biotin carboxylase 1